VIKTFLSDKIISLFKLIAGLFIALVAYGIYNHYSPVPYWDMWDGYLNFFTQAVNGNFQVWFSQHNEHRMIFSKILFYIDLHCFGGQSIFLLIINFLFLSLTAILMAYIVKDIFKSQKEDFRDLQTILQFFSIIMLFSWIQAGNITWAFQSGFFAANFFPLLSFYLLVKSADKENNFIFILSITIGTISAGTMVNGVMALPILFVLSLLLKQNFKKSIFILVVSLVVLYLYFHNYHSVSGHGSIYDTLTNRPKVFFEYMFANLGGIYYYISGRGIISGKGSILLSQITGIILLISSLFFTYLVFIKRDVNKFYLVALSYFVYYGGTAFATAGGRSIFGIKQAFSSRYMTPSLIAWTLLFILYLNYFRNNKKISKIIVFISLAISVALILLQLTGVVVFRDTSENKFDKKIAALSIEMGIRDKQYIEKIYPYIDRVMIISKEAIKKNISIFGNDGIKDVSLKIAKKIDAIPKGNLIGSLDGATFLKEDNNALRISGWVFDNKLKNIPNKLFVVNEDKEIIGYVLTGKNRSDVRKTINKKAYKSGFIGYVIKTRIKGKIFLVDIKNDKKLEIKIDNFT